MAKELKTFNIKFRGIDDWNRPVFKDIDRSLYFGSVNTLFNGNEPKEDVIRFFKENKDDLELFGDHFNCEPHGGKASNWEFNFVDELPPQFVITGIDKSGKRFSPIHTDTPQHYNIWNGTIWKIVEGKRKKVRTIYN